MGYPDCVLDLPGSDTREGRGIRHFAGEGGGRERRSARRGGGGAAPHRRKQKGGRKRASATPPFEKVAILKKADTGFPDPCGKCPGVERATRALPALPLAAPALRSRLRGCASR
ncbi:unnamed protein product [Rangifer tarandus platyrhynchus]|uniref:Uncharacterized protein n=1 Tax=Rangifer tarandus platyrhynchus TaxID=3082113 RepID=A0ABN8ZQI9_RANTA|nr:unnamed protein product [Rangifer tarandus platyrhynchus]